ncbi:MAG: 3-deoxy-8-phosphooctulonate synthase [bacterium]|nr:3-deoxy-8-phosphooctulonate synthase [bacterium]
MKTVNIGSISVGREHRPVLIAGPCTIESRKMLLETGAAIRDLAAQIGFPYILKSSFEKANRTARDSFRGPGLEKGLEDLAAARKEVGVPVLTDVHLPQQVTSVAAVVDCLQIPAFLSRQSEIIESAAKTNLPINIKKGQFLAPAAMRFAIEKAEAVGSGGVLVTERGTMFGYGDLIVDMRSFAILSDLHAPVIFDATHSIQKPGGGHFTGGNSRYIETLASAAAATGVVDGIFLEVHPDPPNALCDADSQLPLIKLKSLLERLRSVFMAVGRW